MAKKNNTHIHLKLLVIWIKSTPTYLFCGNIRRDKTSIMKTKKGHEFFHVLFKVTVEFVYFFLLAFLAPIPIPAAIKKTKPPSIGQAGSNGSTHSSGGGGS